MRLRNKFKVCSLQFAVCIKRFANRQLLIVNFTSPNLLFLLFCFSLASTSNFLSQDTLCVNKVQFIQLNGIIKKTTVFDKAGSEPLDSAKVLIFNENNRLVAEHTTTKKGTCKFKLPLNKKFTIAITKKGYVTKLIEVNTSTPPEKKIKYGFPFEVSIFEEVSGIDYSILTTPVAKIIFVPEENNFGYDNSKREIINSKLKKQYEENFQKQR